MIPIRWLSSIDDRVHSFDALDGFVEMELKAACGHVVTQDKIIRNGAGTWCNDCFEALTDPIPQPAPTSERHLRLVSDNGSAATSPSPGIKPRVVPCHDSNGVPRELTVDLRGSTIVLADNAVLTIAEASMLHNALRNAIVYYFTNTDIM
ncbi:hypothetical protein LWC34_29425 [Kibdelosporangium philippinense]|uniref:Uncharacterized protein n=1 Tax=Kibdelosporangium philippinense TaxID=211113 RepID=A0ABS8ZKD4_9PSEU|nr:hypothetical protein [Kibdelosporangium philippinense]MCE7006918.1 hypothetical protein [Kibdelosporangium philippinense]